MTQCAENLEELFEQDSLETLHSWSPKSKLVGQVGQGAARLPAILHSWSPKGKRAGGQVGQDDQDCLAILLHPADQDCQDYQDGSVK